MQTIPELWLPCITYSALSPVCILQPYMSRIACCARNTVQEVACSHHHLLLIPRLRNTERGCAHAAMDLPWPSFKRI